MNLPVGDELVGRHEKGSRLVVCAVGFSGQFFIELYFYRTLFRFTTVSFWFGGNIYLKTLASGITILKKKRKPYHQCCCKPEFLFGPRNSVTF